MIEIVGEADEQKLSVNCSKCGAVLEYVRVDIQQESLFDMTEFSHIRYFIACPRCQNTVDAAR